MSNIFCTRAPLLAKLRHGRLLLSWEKAGKDSEGRKRALTKLCLVASTIIVVLVAIVCAMAYESGSLVRRCLRLALSHRSEMRLTKFHTKTPRQLSYQYSQITPPILQNRPHNTSRILAWHLSVPGARPEYVIEQRC